MCFQRFRCLFGGISRSLINHKIFRSSQANQRPCSLYFDTNLFRSLITVGWRISEISRLVYNMNHPMAVDKYFVHLYAMIEPQLHCCKLQIDLSGSDCSLLTNCPVLYSFLQWVPNILFDLWTICSLRKYVQRSYREAFKFSMYYFQLLCV